uniref:Uncharacterized protein n=1 Tax=Nelumbo nucifera TaxID=4432 RepID=A0A822ZQI4_NELNU|nr:TPA_asm: hypothetical protein HUJ06_004001 [Nelumbo nucifera]
MFGKSCFNLKQEKTHAIHCVLCESGAWWYLCLLNIPINAMLCVLYLNVGHVISSSTLKPLDETPTVPNSM